MDGDPSNLDFGNVSLNFEENTTENLLNNCDLEPHDYLEIKFFLISVLGSLIGFFGLFGNFSTVVILTRPSMRSPNNMFLTALAIYDSCLLFTAFCIYGMEYIIEYFRAIDLYIAWLTYLRFAFAISHVSQTGSVYTTVSVTVENFLAVCYPRISKRFCTRKISAFTILGITCFSILFNSTRFFELEVFRNPDCQEGKVNWQSYILIPSNLARNPLYGQVFSLWLTNIVMVFLPFLTLLILNFIIAYTIKKSLKKVTHQRKRISELKEKSREASIVLVVIVLIFLICNFWGFVLTLLEQIVGTEYLMKRYKLFYTFSRETINFLAIINSSINFVIYIIFGKDFRKELVVIYGCGISSMTLPLPDQDKLSHWRQASRRKLSSFKTPVIGLRLLKITTFARSIAAINSSSPKISTASTKKISTCSNGSFNDELAEEREFVDAHINFNLSENSVKRKTGNIYNSNGFLTVPSPHHFTVTTTVANTTTNAVTYTVADTLTNTVLEDEGDSVDSCDSNGIHFV